MLYSADVSSKSPCAWSCTPESAEQFVVYGPNVRRKSMCRCTCVRGLNSGAAAGFGRFFATCSRSTSPQPSVLSVCSECMSRGSLSRCCQRCDSPANKTSPRYQRCHQTCMAWAIQVNGDRTVSLYSTKGKCTLDHSQFNPHGPVPGERAPPWLLPRGRAWRRAAWAPAPPQTPLPGPPWPLPGPPAPPHVTHLSGTAPDARLQRTENEGQLERLRAKAVQSIGRPLHTSSCLRLQRMLPTEMPAQSS